MIRLFAAIFFLIFSFCTFAQNFYEYKPNKNYDNDTLTLKFIPFHNNKTITYVDKNGKDYWIYNYLESYREKYVIYKDKKMNANHVEKFGTINNFLVAYDPEEDHKYETYWPLDAKIGDTWKGRFIYFDITATLKEFGDVLINNSTKKYAKISFVDKRTNKEGYAIFVENVGLIEFKLSYQYLRLKNFN